MSLNRFNIAGFTLIVAGSFASQGILSLQPTGNQLLNGILGVTPVLLAAFGGMLISEGSQEGDLQ